MNIKQYEETSVRGPEEYKEYKLMKGKNAIINILRHDPSLANEWIEDEQKSKLKSGHTYLNRFTIEQCLQISQLPDLFSSIKLEDITPAFNCNCGP